MEKKEWQKLDKKINLVERLKSIANKTQVIFDELKKRDSILEEFLSSLKSGSIRKYGKASTTFRIWADEQDIEKDVVDYVYKMLKIVEEERDG